MKTYRIEVKGEVIQFGFFVQAANSHEATCAAKMMHPGFRVLDTVEVKQTRVLEQGEVV